MGFEQEFPRSGAAVDITKIYITANELLTQDLNPRNPNHIQKGALLYNWSFIGFTDLQESISHTWEPYGSIQGRLSEVISQAKGNLAQLGNTFNSAKALGQGAAAALGSGDTTAGAKYKVDTPLVYTGSQRRQISLTFTLMENTSAYDDVLSPIHEFRKLSCAGIEGKPIDIIDFPAIFSVTSLPQTFINIKDCALTDVQILWNSPYVNGNPIRAELTVTFLDLRPLYKSSWGDSDGSITTAVSDSTLIEQREINRNRARGL